MRALLRERLAPVLAEIAPHLSCDRLIDYWFSHDATLDHDLLEQLAVIRARGVAMHLATMQEHERAAYLWDALGLKDRFDAMHYSADLGLVKPGIGFYRAIEARTGFLPEEIFFIDDKLANVEAAQGCGWSAVVWTGKDRVERLLEIYAG